VVRGREEVTGVLLVGGASSRFGSPKALALFEGEKLAIRGYRLLVETFGVAIAVGKEDDYLDLPFPVEDDGREERAAIVGLAAGLRLAETDLCVVLPTDMPHVTSSLLRALAAAGEGAEAAVVQTGPLPGAYRRSALPAVERRIARGELALTGVVEELGARVVEGAADELTNVNTPADLVP
jgi:molybdopterin-guanine dinucleotide biosynthesis protein A